MAMVIRMKVAMMIYDHHLVLASSLSPLDVVLALGAVGMLVVL